MKTLAYYLCIAGVIFLNQTALAANAILDFNFNQVGSSTAINGGTATGTFATYNGYNSTSTADSTLMGIAGVSGYALNNHAAFPTTPTSSTTNAKGVYLKGTSVAQGGSSVDLTDFTISFWYQGATLTGDNQRIFAATNGSSPSITLIIGGSGSVILYVNSTSTNSMTSAIKFTAADSYSDTTWKYMALSFSSAGNGTYSQATFYTGVAGSSTLTTVGTYNCNTGLINPIAFDTFYVGCESSNSRGFSGNTDNFQLYDAALSQTEVQTLLTAQAIPEPSIVCLWIVSLGVLWFGRKRMAEKIYFSA